jgi:hypothetical protein
MKEYHFRIGEESGLQMYFKITANSPDEAVAIANEEIAQEDPSAAVSLRLRIHDAYVDLSSDFRVDKSMIIEECPTSREVLMRALRYLKSQDYEYSSEEDILWHDDEPQFTKSIFTDDLGIYAFLEVSARYEVNIQEYSFWVGAVLNPVGPARIADGDGGLNYSVHFRDQQLYTTLDELAVVLAFYESKFLALMTALRQADPLDGLPVERAE